MRTLFWQQFYKIEIGNLQLLVLHSKYSLLMLDNIHFMQINMASASDLPKNSTIEFFCSLHVDRWQVAIHWDIVSLTWKIVSEKLEDFCWQPQPFIELQR